MSGPSFIAPPLATGLEVIDAGAVLTFIKYTRLVLPLDGFVFWVRADLQSPVTQEFEFSGSLHYTTTTNQQEDESFGLNKIIFTTTNEITDLNEVSSTVMYLGLIDNIRFAFSRRDAFYRQSGLFHYGGDAVYPAMASQIIDTVQQLNDRSLVVSNSLPLWLALALPTPYPWLGGVGFPLFPSYLVEDNFVPPYASVHIEPDSTEGLQMAPYLDRDFSHWQLVREHVRITFYGLRHEAVLDFIDYVSLTSRDTDNIGIFNIPVPRDEKYYQAELGVLAIKKTVEFDITYNQQLARNAARQLILHCVPTYSPTA